ncbi:discoidin domain-containing protein [Streptomyces sp. NPDC051738]|uniref:galactose-binding domain-containing protein n=1 Tax=Streptomyces sp. NPDC051738 TaxID=3365672 RepID=UPI0037D262D4
MTGTRIAWELDKTNYQYKIEGSTDNSTWTTLVDNTASPGTRQVQTAAFQAQARYVRTVTGLPTGVYASIRNLEVYDVLHRGPRHLQGDQPQERQGLAPIE